jgi:hypothetical protein
MRAICFGAADLMQYLFSTYSAGLPLPTPYPAHAKEGPPVPQAGGPSHLSRFHLGYVPRYPAYDFSFRVSCVCYLMPEISGSVWRTMGIKS